MYPSVLDGTSNLRMTIKLSHYQNYLTYIIIITILFIGLIFSGMIFYIIYAVSTNKESLEDAKIRNKRQAIQKEKIGKLFPKKK